MVLACRIVVLVSVLAALAWLAATVPDFGPVALGKLTEGGMWSALAVFIAAALVLGYRRRGAGPDDRRKG